MNEVEQGLPCPIHAQVEGSGCVLQAGAQRVLEPVVHLLHVEWAFARREDRFDEHALVPLAFGTDFEVFGVARFGVETVVAKHDHVVLEGFDEVLEVHWKCVS